MIRPVLLPPALAVAFGLCASQALAQAAPAAPKIGSVSTFSGGVGVRSDQANLWLVEGDGLEALGRLPEDVGEGPNVVALVCQVAAAGPPEGCSTLPGKAGVAEVQKALALLPALSRNVTVPGAAGSPVVAVVAFGGPAGLLAGQAAGQAACLTNSCSTPARTVVRQAVPGAAGAAAGASPLTSAIQAGFAAGKSIEQTMAEQGFTQVENSIGDDGLQTRRFTNGQGGNIVMRTPPGVEPGAPPPPGAVMIQRQIPAPAPAP